MQNSELIKEKNVDFKAKILKKLLLIPLIIDNKIIEYPIEYYSDNSVINSICYVLNYNIKNFIVSRVFIEYNYKKYIKETFNDENQFKNNNMLYALKSLKKYGFCDEKIWDFTKSIDISPNKFCYELAIKYNDIEIYCINNNILGLKTALYNKILFIVEIKVYESFKDINNIFIPDYNNEKCIGWFSTVCVGYDNSKKVWIMRNTLNNYGYFYLPYEYLIIQELFGNIYLIETQDIKYDSDTLKAINYHLIPKIESCNELQNEIKTQKLNSETLLKKENKKIQEKEKKEKIEKEKKEKIEKEKKEKIEKLKEQKRIEKERKEKIEKLKEQKRIEKERILDLDKEDKEHNIKRVSINELNPKLRELIENAIKGKNINGNEIRIRVKVKNTSKVKNIDEFNYDF